eukprot:scaffold4090_cov84-Skeletonema_marinoi.AAC.2
MWLAPFFPTLSSASRRGAFVDIVEKQPCYCVVVRGGGWRKKILLDFNNAFVWELRREGFGSGRALSPPIVQDLSYFELLEIMVLHIHSISMIQSFDM